jgi:hypothetical protein
VIAAIGEDMKTADDVAFYKIQTVSVLTGVSARRIRSWGRMLNAARTKESPSAITSECFPADLCTHQRPRSPAWGS